MGKRRLIWLLLLLFSFLKMNAQDIHFTQFQNSPLSLNPANTGCFDGNIRFVANHRNQWNSISVPFLTSLFSFDTRLLEDRLQNDALGLGMLIMDDRVSEGHLSNLNVMLNASYIRTFGSSQNNSLCFGLQTGFFQKRIDLTKLTFASQYSDGTFDTGIPSGENTSVQSAANLDVNCGVLYQLQKSNGFGLYTGLALFHLNMPNESLSGKVSKLPQRVALNFGLVIPIDDITNFTPELLYMKQNKAKEFLITAKADRSFKTENDRNIKVSLGTGFRASDAIVFLTGLGFDKWKLCFSYDFNISKLRPATNYKGGYEISIIFTDKIFPGKNKIPVGLPCIRL